MVKPHETLRESASYIQHHTTPLQSPLHKQVCLGKQIGQNFAKVWITSHHPLKHLNTERTWLISFLVVYGNMAELPKQEERERTRNHHFPNQVETLVWLPYRATSCYFSTSPLR